MATRACVSVIGLGKMGAAMAHRLAACGHPLALWNRSVDKAHALQREIAAAGAPAEVTVAERAEDAVAKGGEVVVMVLSTMATTAAVLESLRASEALEGKVLVNLTSGNPDEGRDMDALATSLNVGMYVDGAYCGAPSKAAAGAGTLFLSGPSREAVGAITEKVLKNLGKNVYAGTTGASRALDYAVVDMFMANYLFFTSNLGMLEKEGVDPALVMESMRDRFETIPPALELFRARQQSRAPADYAANPVVTVDTWRNFFMGRVPYMQRHGMATVVPDFVGGICDEVIAQGHGADDMSRLQEVVRYAKPAADADAK